MRVLLAVDGSECAQRAVEFLVGKLAGGHEPHEVHLLAVQPPIPYPRAVSVIGHERVQEYYEQEGQAALKPARERLEDAGIRYTERLRLGDPAETIAQYAAEAAVDMILMGTHGRGIAGRLVMGSVSMKVMQLAEVPVLLVK